MKIVVLDGHAENPGDLSWQGLEALGDVTVYDRTDVHDEALIRARIGDAEAVYTNKTPLTGATIAAAPNLQFIGVLATGYNVVDLEAARQRGIPVCNVPAYGTQEVAQYAMALLLEICGSVGLHDRLVHEGKWAACPDFCFWETPILGLAGKTMGIIGFGRIGRALGRMAAAMGMKVLASGIRPCPEGEAIADYVPLEELLAKADVISLNCPLTPQTEGLINRQSIERMKPGVILINNGRGPLVMEQDLADALNCGRVYAAGLDVVSVEPIRPDNPLLTAKNCIITPHISWAARESRQRLMDIAVENLRAFLAGRPVNVVNGAV